MPGRKCLHQNYFKYNNVAAARIIFPAQFTPLINRNAN
jgi:hypothetical protein